MTVITDRLLDTLRVSCPGSSPEVRRHELINAIDEFCRESLAWQEIVPVTLLTTQRVYSLAPTGTDIVHVFSMRHATLDLSKGVYQFGVLSFTNYPTATDITTPLFVQAALTPEPIALNLEIDQLLPEDMWNDHERTFEAGAMARLMMQPAKPYSNMQLAVMRRRDFWSRMAQARIKAHVNDGIGAQSWRFRRWA